MIDIVSFKKSLHKFDSVGLGICGRFGQHDWVLGGVYNKFVFVGVGPDFLHGLPVHDVAVLDGI